MEYMLSKTVSYRDFYDPLRKSIGGQAQREPTRQQINNGKIIARIVDLFLFANPNCSVRFTSFFRSPLENVRVGGSSTSTHPLGLSADMEIFCNGKEDNSIFYNWLRSSGLSFDQMILSNSITNPTMIHLGMGAKMRNQIMLEQGGKYSNI